MYSGVCDEFSFCRPSVHSDQWRFQRTVVRGRINFLLLLLRFWLLWRVPYKGLGTLSKKRSGHRWRLPFWRGKLYYVHGTNNKN